MEKYEKIIRDFRAELHACPEPAFQEKQTKERILHFLQENTQLEMIDRGAWMYAKWPGREVGANKRKLAFRADFDAVAGPDGQAAHLCGHDGHAAILCGLAKYISDAEPQNTIYLIFQPAEEIGEGAKLCRQLLKEEGIGEIYGFHNIPGFPRGAVLWRQGTFACASTGLELKWIGEPSHAAYPENGRNPAAACAETILWMQTRLQQPHEGMLLCTVIGAEIGSAAYGVAAGEAILRLTVRGEKEEEFEALLRDIRTKAAGLAARDGLQLESREIERFPATVNQPAGIMRVREAAELAGRQLRKLKQPMRWSEDFGYYLEESGGSFFGIGAGEDHAQLHTPQYGFPDEIIADALEVFIALLQAKR
jgi:amidohydrolase